MAQLNHSENPAAIFHPSSAEEIIVKAQEVLALDPHPDSSATAVQLVRKLREILDSPEALEIYENVVARREGGYRSAVAASKRGHRRFVG